MKKLPPIEEAIEAGDVAAVRAHVAKKPSLLTEDWLPDASYLYLAAEHGQTDVCAALVELGMDVNDAKAGRGRAVVLDAAAFEGRLETVKWLLQHGARVDGHSDSVSTALMAAAMEGHPEVARVLLDAGAELDREHLTLPFTALDWAEFYKVKKGGQGEVADLLRARGAIRPFQEDHDWSGDPHEAYVTLIEAAVGRVHPRPMPGPSLVRRTRFAPKQYLFHLLFTADASDRVGSELAICLPHDWPLNLHSLQEPRFRWPVDLLQSLSRAGQPIAHGDVIGPDFTGLTLDPWPAGITDFLAVRHAAIESARKKHRGAPQTLLLLPSTLKKRLAPGKEARARAAKKATAKWGPQLVVPLDLASR